MPGPRPAHRGDRADELRRMVLLLETADVLEVRARRATDPAQVAVLLRRAEHRRREAAELRELLAADGAALAGPGTARAGADAGAARPSPPSAPCSNGSRLSAKSIDPRHPVRNTSVT